MVNKETIINEVIEQIKIDIQNCDISAIEELLMCCPKKNLMAYLPENKQNQLKNDKEKS